MTMDASASRSCRPVQYFMIRNILLADIPACTGLGDGWLSPLFIRARTLEIPITTMHLIFCVRSGVGGGQQPPRAIIDVDNHGGFDWQPWLCRRNSR
jgi:hypothetical protein